MQGWRHKETGKLFDVQTKTSPIAEILSKWGGEPEDYIFIDTIPSESYPIDIETQRESVKKQLNAEMHQYLSKCGYDQTVQNTLLAFQAKLEKIIRKGGGLTESQQAADDALDQVWDFISQVLSYYEEREQAVLQSENPTLIEWDYTQFTSLHPQETIWSIKERIQN